MSVVERLSAFLRAQIVWILSTAGLIALRLGISPALSTHEDLWTGGIDDVKPTNARERLLLDELRRLLPKDLPNARRIRTPFGWTQTWRLGPEDGKRIILVHGLTAPSTALFVDVAKRLAIDGFSVLLFDVYGRGYSSAPKMEFSTDLAASQIAAVLDSVGWQSATVFGASMVRASSCATPDDDRAVPSLAVSLDSTRPEQTLSCSSVQPAGGKAYIVTGLPSLPSACSCSSDPSA